MVESRESSHLALLFELIYNLLIFTRNIFSSIHNKIARVMGLDGEGGLGVNSL